jgi:hypothetical protein
MSSTSSVPPFGAAGPSWATLTLAAGGNPLMADDTPARVRLSHERPIPDARTLAELGQRMLSPATSDLIQAVRAGDAQAARQALRNGARPGQVPRDGLAAPMAQLLEFAGRVNRLMPDLRAAQAGGQDYLNTALLEYDLQGARDLLAARRGDLSDEAFWQASLERADHCGMRAWMALAPDSTVQALSSLPFSSATAAPAGVLHRGLAWGGHGRALLNHLLSLPHFPEQLGQLVRLQGDEPTGVERRRLAAGWISARQGGGMDYDYAPFASPAAIGRHFDPAEMDALYRGVVLGSSENYLIGNERFGALVADLWEDMRPGDRRWMLAGSSGHAMALELRRESGPAGADRCVVHVFDPDVPGGHREAISHDADAIRGWTLAGFLPDPDHAARHYPDGQRMAVVHLAPDAMRTSMAEPAGGRTLARSEYADTLLSSEALHFLIADGLDAALEDVLPHVMQLPPAERKAVLAARHPIDGPGLNVSAAHGSVQAARSAMRAILHSGLAPQDQVELLLAHHPEDGSSALARGLHGGQTGFVLAYADAVLTSELPLECQIAALNTGNDTGSKTLHLAARHGNAAAVEAFIARILASGLPDRDKIALLQAADPQGYPALDAAARAERNDIVEAFVRCVLASSLPQGRQVELLDAETPDGSAMFAAAKRGEDEVVLSYGRAIVRSDLPEDLQLELALGKQERWSGPLIALAECCDGVLRAYASLLASAEWSASGKEQVVEMLTAKDSEGDFILHGILHSDLGGWPASDRLSDFLDQLAPDAVQMARIRTAAGWAVL